MWATTHTHKKPAEQYMIARRTMDSRVKLPNPHRGNFLPQGLFPLCSAALVVAGASQGHLASVLPLVHCYSMMARGAWPLQETWLHPSFLLLPIQVLQCHVPTVIVPAPAPSLTEFLI